MIRDEILLAETLSELLSAEPEIEILEQVFSQATFRFVPLDLESEREVGEVEAYLDRLNHQLAVQLDERSIPGLCKRRVQGSTAIQIDTPLPVDAEIQVLDMTCLVARMGHELDARLRCRTPLCG